MKSPLESSHAHHKLITTTCTEFILSTRVGADPKLATSGSPKVGRVRVKTNSLKINLNK